MTEMQKTIVSTIRKENLKQNLKTVFYSMAFITLAYIFMYSCLYFFLEFMVWANNLSDKIIGILS